MRKKFVQEGCLLPPKNVVNYEPPIFEIVSKNCKGPRIAPPAMKCICVSVWWLPFFPGKGTAQGSVGSKIVQSCLKFSVQSTKFFEILWEKMIKNIFWKTFGGLTSKCWPKNSTQPDLGCFAYVFFNYSVATESPVTTWTPTQHFYSSPPAGPSCRSFTKPLVHVCPRASLLHCPRCLLSTNVPPRCDEGGVVPAGVSTQRPLTCACSHHMNFQARPNPPWGGGGLAGQAVQGTQI